jgi:hypothetical protein
MLALIMFQRAPRSLPVAGGAFDVRPAALQAVERDAVGRRVDRRRHEGLHAVRDGVHAGGRRQQRRQAQRELGVEQRGLGHQVPAVEAQLAAVVDDDDGAARHLAAGAGGGGHGDQRRTRSLIFGLPPSMVA